MTTHNYITYHGEHVSDSLKRVVKTPICHVNKHLLDRLVIVVWVDTLRRSKLLRCTTDQLNRVRQWWFR